MNSRNRLLLATHNEHKIQEIKHILGIGYEYRTLCEYVSTQIQETGCTLLENSTKKALYAYEITGLPALADDSGLFIEALDNKPGVFSARYGQTDDQRIYRVLQEMQGRKHRRASFRAVFVLVLDTHTHRTFKGICPGRIANEARGKKGFGYDPIFIPEGYTKTFAELGAEVKNRISHRARALTKVKEYLSR